MGWLNEDDPGHEGFAVDLVEEAVTYKDDGLGGSTYLRELSYYQDHDRELPQAGLRRARTHLCLSKDAPEPRPVQAPTMGEIVVRPEVGGLHHRYERLAA